MAPAFQRRVSGFALVAFLLGLGLPFVGAGHLGFNNNDDPACGPDVVASSGQAAEIHAAVAPSPLQHCAICHLQRANRGAAPSVPLGTVWTARWTNALLAKAAGRVASASLDQQPARAPPAPLLR